MHAARIIVTILFAGVMGAAVFHDEIPRWRLRGAVVVAHVPLSHVGAFPIRLKPAGAIVVLSDSNASGSRVGGRDSAFPALLAAPGRAGAEVINLGHGGATVPSANTWQSKPAPQLVIIMFGTNDSAPRRVLGTREPVPPEVYAARLTSLVQMFVDQRSRVLILAAPPAGSVAMDRRIAPYRAAARNVASRTGVHFRDPMEAFTPTVGGEWAAPTDLQRDGLHLSHTGQLRLALWLDQLLA